MDILDVRELCLSLPQSEETTPFDETTLVYKVAGKMFLLADMTDGRAVNVKCDPDPCDRAPGTVRRGDAGLAHEQTPLEYGTHRRRPARKN